MSPVLHLIPKKNMWAKWSRSPWSMAFRFLPFTCPKWKKIAETNGRIGPRADAGLAVTKSAVSTDPHVVKKVHWFYLTIVMLMNF
jgi:hypothetical protein